MNHLKISAEEAIKSLRNSEKEFINLFTHASLEVEIYKPDNIDTQQPHEKDEVYVIISGTGNFYCAGNAISFKPGDFLFVPAGIEHRFIDFTNNFATWVFFLEMKAAPSLSPSNCEAECAILFFSVIQIRIDALEQNFTDTNNRYAHFLNIGCDQVSKKIVRHHVSENETIEILHNHFIVTRVENTGAFLSFGDSLSKAAKNVWLSVLPLIALGFASIYIFTKQNLPAMTLISICFIIGGGIGNLFDRIAYGSVTDFLYIHFGIFQTGVFNMADLSITTGAVVILLQSTFRRMKVRQ